MPWQQMVADVAGEYDPDTGIPYYREIVVTVPRQSGKTTLFLAFQVDRCLNWATMPHRPNPVQRSIYTAQTGKDARDKWVDELFPQLEQSSLAPILDGRPRRGMGNEHVLWRTGSIIRIGATAESSGHSKTLDQGVLDEIWHDKDNRREQGLRPAMATREDAQILFMPALRTPDNPSGTISPAVVRAELDGMDLTEFIRAYGNLPTPGADMVIPEPTWFNVTSPVAAPTAPFAIGAAVAEDRKTAGVVIAGANRTFELFRHDPDVDWLPRVVDELAAKWDTKAHIDKQGPASTIKWIDQGRINELTSDEYVRACGQMYDAIADGTVTFREDDAFDQAVLGVQKRSAGDRFTWHRTASAGDVVPLEAATCAYAGIGGSTPRPFVL
jgi:hypothetical protein